MTKVERSIIIHATSDELDAITLDGTRFSEWFAGIHNSEPDSLFPNAGGVVSAIYKVAGISFKITMTSLRLVRGTSLLLRLDGMLTGKTRWLYSPEGEATRVTCRFEYEMPGGEAGQTLNKLVVERMNIANLEKSLNNLKTLVEGE